MSDSPAMPVITGPYAPQIPYKLYLAEKRNWAGTRIGAMVYGIVVVLFFNCLSALFGPANRARSLIKWALVAHIGAMFTFQTISLATQLHIESISYIDNRALPDLDGSGFSGPIAYNFLTFGEPISMVSVVTFILNNWLADGLLLYRCCVIFSKNYWAVAIPFLMYLASLTIGILYIYDETQINSINTSLNLPDFGTPFYAISFSLNVLLTLMIVARLVLHDRSFRKITGTQATAGKVYKTVITILVESFALHAISFLLYMVPWAVGSSVTNIFYTTFTGIQVIAPLLIVLRVANRTAVTSSSMAPGTTGSLSFGGETTNDSEMTRDSETTKYGNPPSPTDSDGERAGGLNEKGKAPLNESSLPGPEGSLVA